MKKISKNIEKHSLSPRLISLIENGLKTNNYGFNQHIKIAESILELSNLYKQNVSQSKIWSQAKFRAAYWCYFFPLNYLRMSYVLNEAKKLGFFPHDPIQWLDFGCGLGTTYQSVLDTLTNKHVSKFEMIDESSELLKYLSSFKKDLDLTNIQFKQNSEIPPSNSKEQILVLSYTLNELKNLTKNIFTYSHIVILEPSTQTHARNLMSFRESLINNNYSIWGPCTHQNNCPLLTKSKSDWCHQRIHISLPNELKRIESHLPMKNNTVTFSYLLASKTPNQVSKTIRVIGDTLFEKGKTRQSICQNENIEYLSWLKKDGEPAQIPRGSRIQLTTEPLIKGNELRVGNQFTIL